MFEVTFNGNNSGFTDGKIIADGNIVVVTIWNDDNSPTCCIFVNAGNVFPV